MKLNLVLALAFLAAAAPAFAESAPHVAHLRAQVYHDHAPHVHNRTPQPYHQA